MVKKDLYPKILALINEGTYPSKIAKLLKISRQNLNFYIRRLQTEGKITVASEGFITIFKLTEKGYDALCKSSLVEGAETFTTPSFDNLHNLSFKFKIKKYAEIWFPNETQLNGWIRKFDWFGDTLVSVYGKASLEVRMRIKAENHHEATWKAYQQVLKFAQLLMNEHGIELDYPVLNRKPHYVIGQDPVAEEVAPKMTVYAKNVGHIDKSKDEGELEYYTPENVSKYIRMPLTMEEVRAHQMAQQTQLNALVEAVDDVRKRMPPPPSVSDGNVGGYQ